MENQKYVPFVLLAYVRWCQQYKYRMRCVEEQQFTLVLFSNLDFLIDFHKIASNFTKIRQPGAEVIVRMKRRADMTKLIWAFRDLCERA
jgi:hypothetical protein